MTAIVRTPFVAFVERKLIEHCVKKIVPTKADLARVYRTFAQGREVEKIIKRELKKPNGATDIKPPSDLSTQVRRYLEEHPQVRWDEAVNEIVKRRSEGAP
jgi:hypothetical protein